MEPLTTGRALRAAASDPNWSPSPDRLPTFLSCPSRRRAGSSPDRGAARVLRHLDDTEPRRTAPWKWAKKRTEPCISPAPTGCHRHCVSAVDATTSADSSSGQLPPVKPACSLPCRPSQHTTPMNTFAINRGAVSVGPPGGRRSSPRSCRIPTSRAPRASRWPGCARTPEGCRRGLHDGQGARIAGRCRRPRHYRTPSHERNRSRSGQYGSGSP